MGLEQVLPLQFRVDRGLITIKGYSIFAKLQDRSLLIRCFSVISRTLVGETLPLCKDADGVFNSSSQ